MFVSVPWEEMRDLYCHHMRGTRKNLGVVGVEAFVDTWQKHIGDPKGFHVKRYRYDTMTDRITMDIDWIQKRKG